MRRRPPCNALAQARSTRRSSPPLMPHAVPTTLGLEVGGWLSALTRSKLVLRGARTSILALQFGGAAAISLALSRTA